MEIGSDPEVKEKKRKRDNTMEKFNNFALDESLDAEIGRQKSVHDRAAKKTEMNERSKHVGSGIA